MTGSTCIMCGQEDCKEPTHSEEALEAIFGVTKLHDILQDNTDNMLLALDEQAEALQSLLDRLEKAFADIKIKHGITEDTE